MTRRHAIAILGSVLLLGAGAALVYAWSIQSSTPAEPKQYVNQEYGISFQYPERYTFAEIERGTALQRHSQIVLTDEPAGEEAPPALYFSVFEHQPGSKTLEEWASSTPESNFQVKRGDATAVTVGGISGIRYAWDGLYPGESIALSYKGNVVVFSGTYRDVDDAIRADFLALIDSVRFARDGEMLPATTPPAPDSFACTMEAKLCPDGSYVGRTGPACEFTACPNAETAASVEVGIGQSGSGLGIQLVPLEVVEDSRCPLGVMCIQAGTVRVRTQAGTEASASTIVFSLNQPQIVQGKTVTLTDVAPAKRAADSISSSEYVFTFTVTGS